MALNIKGYAAVFEVADEQKDILLKEMKITVPRELKILWQHNLEIPIGKIAKLTRNNFGLLVEGNIIDGTTQAQDACTLIKDKVVTGLSIGFKVDDFCYNSHNRCIKSLILYEISVVTFPANKYAQIKHYH